MNIFDKIDNRCKPFFKLKDEQFFLRIITKKETFLRYPQVAEMLGRLATESEIDLNKSLEQKDERLKTLHKPHELWQPTKQWIDGAFGTSANRTILVIEDSESFPISTTIALINSPEDRKKMNVNKDVGTFVYITHAVTQEEWKGKGLFSLTMNKLSSMLMNSKREMPTPIDYSISVSCAAALKKDRSEINYVMNLPRYAQMWQNRFEHNKLQVRLQDKKDSSKQEGTDRHSLNIFVDHEGLNETRVSRLIEKNKDSAESQGKFVRGLYLEGRQKLSYAESVEKRKKDQTKIISRL